MTQILPALICNASFTIIFRHASLSSTYRPPSVRPSVRPPVIFHTKRRDDIDMVADMEVDKVAGMVADVQNQVYQA